MALCLPGNRRGCFHVESKQASDFNEISLHSRVQSCSMCVHVLSFFYSDLSSRGVLFNSGSIQFASVVYIPRERSRVKKALQSQMPV